MARVTTSRPVNASQLCFELGRVALRVRHSAPTVVEAPEVDMPTLTDAVEAHVADPDWVDPEPPPPSDRERRQAALEQLRVKAREVFEGDGTFTAAQIQKIVAALTLRQLGE